MGPEAKALMRERLLNAIRQENMEAHQEAVDGWNDGSLMEIARHCIDERTKKSNFLVCPRAIGLKQSLRLDLLLQASSKGRFPK